MSTEVDDGGAGDADRQVYNRREAFVDFQSGRPAETRGAQDQALGVLRGRCVIARAGRAGPRGRQALRGPVLLLRPRCDRRRPARHGPEVASDLGSDAGSLARLRFVPATQALYRTQNQLGQPTATVATIIPPPAAGPPPPTKLLSYQTFYDGLDDSCRPSYTLQGGVPATRFGERRQQPPAWLRAGRLHGGELGLRGAGRRLHGRPRVRIGTLDGIRAAESKLGLPATAPVGLVGYSGGSIASDWASELEPSYAPELQHRRRRRGRHPGGLCAHVRLHQRQHGLGGRHPCAHPRIGPGVPRGPSAVLQCDRSAGPRPGRQGMPDAERVSRSPLRGPSQAGVPELASRSPSSSGSSTTRSWGALARREAALHGGREAPTATGDGVMPAGDMTGLAHTYCGRGVSVQFHIYTGSDHVASIGRFDSDARQFMQTALRRGNAGQRVRPRSVPATRSLRCRYLRVLSSRPPAPRHRRRRSTGSAASSATRPARGSAASTAGSARLGARRLSRRAPCGSRLGA